MSGKDLFKERQVTVMGLGRFGGGRGVVRWLCTQGAHVLLTDICTEEQLADSLCDLSEFVDKGTLTCHLGGHDEADFVKTDLIVVNPAVPKPWDNPYLNAARAEGVTLTTEIRLVTERLNRERVIGVTGSAGKSTTASMIHHILTAAGHRSHLGGNIGGSLLNQLDDVGDDDWIVLELSSAMLYWLGARVGFDDAPGWSPHVGVLTNVLPNHLDWHGTFGHYEASKQNIFRYQQDGDAQVTEEQFETKRALPLSIPGKHNQQNGFFAMAAVLRAANVFPQIAAPSLATFTGLPHRLQLVHEGDGGRQFFNDSKSTTPDATVLAVDSFKKPSMVHVIVGGYDKGVDLTAIAQLGKRVAGLYCIGQTGPAIASSALDARHVERCETLDVAVGAAMARMEDDHVLLLSPGCASWDQFEHFERRGERFVELVTNTSG